MVAEDKCRGVIDFSEKYLYRISRNFTMTFNAQAAAPAELYSRLF
jgi:hypothetical protein